MCAEPWPCGPARVDLLAAYRDDRLALVMTLAGLRMDAAVDGVAGDLWHRFVGWARAAYFAGARRRTASPGTAYNGN